ncbi:MAG: Glyoxalase-like domain protein [candidate division BRC1 bacterium ADurb.BinA292]|nr:MAG: Glyoxalase-like domain protein [candidate division BRC1 bacterium ADurb.BinA292]
MPELKRINVVFLYAADMERMRTFYEETVGFGEPCRVTDDWVEYALGEGARFALHRAMPGFRSGSRGAVQFSIAVDDLDGACRELETAGVTILRPPEYGPGFRLAEFEDPEGNPIRLIEFEA